MKTSKNRLAVFGAVLLLLGGLAVSGFSQEKSERHVFLLIGQSNMAGRAKIEADDKKPIDGAVLWNVKEGKWESAVPPYNVHSPARKGLGMQRLNCGPSFARAYAEKHPDVEVGIVCVARGGTAIRQWNREKPDAMKLYEHAIKAAKAALAIEGSTLKGILWHQGESDSAEEKVEAYPARLAELVANVREDLKAPEVPFVYSELGEWRAEYATFNKMIVDQPGKIANTACISTKGLTNLDNAHFDTAGQRGIGKRFAEALDELISK